MSPTTIVVNTLALAALAVAVVKDKEKGKRALRIALRSFLGMLPMVLVIILLIGLLLGFVPPASIQSIVGEESGILGILISTALGGILFIPSLIAFPLAASLVEEGAALGAVAGLITSLTMIGTLTIPLEVRELGLKFTVLRNGLGLVFAILIALAMGAIL